MATGVHGLSVPSIPNVSMHQRIYLFRIFPQVCGRLHSALVHCSPRRTRTVCCLGPVQVIPKTARRTLRPLTVTLASDLTGRDKQICWASNLAIVTLQSYNNVKFYLGNLISRKLTADNIKGNKASAFVGAMVKVGDKI